MTKEEFKALSEKISNNLASKEEILAFAEELNNQIEILNKELES